MPDLPHLDIDRVSRTAYLLLREAPVADTEEAVESLVLLDLDADGFVIGVEVIGLPVEFDVEDLLSSYRFRDEDAAAVRALPGQLRA